MAVLIWIVLVMAVLYLAQRLVYTLAGLRRLSYTRSFSDGTVFAGQTIWLNETIVNRKRLPIPWLRVETLLPAQLLFRHKDAQTSINRGDQLQNHASLFNVPAYTEIVRRHEIVCPQRGKFRISSYTLSYGDMVGVKFKPVQQAGANDLVVFPKLRQLHEFPMAAQRYLQSIRSMSTPIREDHYYVSGIRAYRDGDPLRLINWSATAKTGHLLVHKRESMVDSDLTVFLNAELLDQSANRRITPAQFEEALSFAASALRYVIDGGGKAGLIFNGTGDAPGGLLVRVPAGGGEAQMTRLLHAMASFQPVATLALDYALEQLVSERTSGMNYLIVSGFVNAKQERLIAKLRAQGNQAEKLLLWKEGAPR